jgi:hypothetical protein
MDRFSECSGTGSHTTFSLRGLNHEGGGDEDGNVTRTLSAKRASRDMTLSMAEPGASGTRKTDDVEMKFDRLAGKAPEPRIIEITVSESSRSKEPASAAGMTPFGERIKHLAPKAVAELDEE